MILKTVPDIQIHTVIVPDTHGTPEIAGLIKNDTTVNWMKSVPGSGCNPGKKSLQIPVPHDFLNLP
jgi:hypothetical protein